MCGFGKGVGGWGWRGGLRMGLVGEGGGMGANDEGKSKMKKSP